MVMDYSPHCVRDLLRGDKKRKFSPAEVKSLVQQLLRGIAHLHDNWTMHRDLKPANLLIDDDGTLKIADFGNARSFGDPQTGALTPGNQVVTLSYRAPELLYGTETYSQSVDMWSVGCIFAEFIAGRPLFAANDIFRAVRTIFSILGTPTEATWPGWNGNWFKPEQTHTKNRLAEKFSRNPNSSRYLSRCGLDLIQKLLRYDPTIRISAAEALKHP